VEARPVISRRVMLARSGGSLLGIVLSAVASRPALAKAQKSDFQYQQHPKDGKKCADCKFFSTDRSGSDTGTCELVEGTVNRDGWCVAFSPKA
jgi:hypothetical protein